MEVIIYYRVYKGFGNLQAKADMEFVSTFTGQWSGLELLTRAAQRVTGGTDTCAGKVGARVWIKVLTQLFQGDICVAMGIVLL